MAVAAGDVHVFLGSDATPGAGETVLRGNAGANAVLERSFPGTPRRGGPGHKPFVVAPVGGVDVVFTGRITKA